MVGVTQLRPRDTAGESKPAGGRAAVWTVAEMILVAAVCFSAYFASLGVGFLLDDFVHVDYAARAWQGDWQGFLHAFSGNWTGKTDNLTSYRPAISVSFLLDALFWRANAFGYHLSNVLMFFGCCALVRQISLELSSFSNMKFGRSAALCAALLFAVYPLHPESVTWIIGRVDVQCALFYLASIWCYMRYRRQCRSWWLWVSLAAFLAALPSKEMAVTLPAVVALSEAILFFRRPDSHAPSADREKTVPQPKSTRHEVKDSVMRVLPFWLLLGAYAVLRTALIGTLVGGYGGSFLECWRNFFDKATAFKIFLPANEEIGMPANFKNALTALYIAVAGIAGFRLWARLLDLRPLLFLSAWMVVSILPAYQIWHIYPNLVGSRLFFLPSAPFCIILAFLAVPVAVGATSRAMRMTLAISGAGILAGIAGLWFALLQLNLVPYVVAGRQMDNVRAQVASIAAATPSGSRTLFLDLPQDHQGAGMLGRPEFLEMLANRPFAGEDLSDRVLTIESHVAGSHEYVIPECLRQILADSRLHAAYRFDAQAGQFVPWRPQAGEPEYGFSAGASTASKMTWEPAEIRPTPATKWWAGSHAIARVVTFPDHLTVYPGSTGATLILSETAIDPLAACIVNVQIQCTAGDTATSIAGDGKIAQEKCRFVWATSAAGGARSEMAFDGAADGILKTYPARYRSWSLGGNVTAVGLKFLPGNYRVDLYGLRISNGEDLMPRMRLLKGGQPENSDPYSAWLLNATPRDEVLVDFDATRIPGATAAKLLLTKPGRIFATGAAPDLVSSGDLAEVSANLSTSAAGRIHLPNQILNQPGLRQVRVVAVDAHGAAIGWPSDPQSLSIEP